MEELDFYKILGVGKRATEEQIKKAFRRKVKKLHPDCNGGEEKPFQELHLAYSILMNAKRRKLYDDTGEYKDNVVDNDQRHCTELLIEVYQFAVGQLINAGQQTPTLLEIMKGKLGSIREETEKERLQFAKAKLQHLQNAKMFQVPDGHENALALAAADLVLNCDANIDVADERLRLLKVAVDTLAIYKYGCVHFKRRMIGVLSN